VTRAQRRIRSRKTRAASGGIGASPNFAPVAAGIALTENPNRGKRHAPNLAYMSGFIADLADAERRAYAPLTVSTEVRTDRAGRRLPESRRSRSQYTV
jgi:hypothetical protein